MPKSKHFVNFGPFSLNRISGKFKLVHNLSQTEDPNTRAVVEVDEYLLMRLGQPERMSHARRFMYMHALAPTIMHVLCLWEHSRMPNPRIAIFYLLLPGISGSPKFSPKKTAIFFIIHGFVSITGRG